MLLMEQHKGLAQQVQDLNEKLERISGEDIKRGKKEKKFKLKWSTTYQMKMNLKKNKVLCIHLFSNRRMEIKFYELENGMLVVRNKKLGDKYYNAAQNFVFMYKKYPVYIIKEWCVDPMGDEQYDRMLSTVDNKEYERDVDAGRLIDPQTITIRAIEAREALQKKPMGSMWIWIAVIGIVVVGAYLLFGQKKG
jgi:hypothetical protein